MNAIEMSHVTKTYPSFTLKDVSLTLPSGCIMGLIGENGAGKSTVIKLLMNAAKRDGGDIKILGNDNTKKDFVKTKEEIGVVLDEAYFPEMLNAKKVCNVMRRVYRNWDEETFYRYVRRFQLPDKKIFKEYSRGMKMKLAIAAALSHQAKLLILDEATSGLDPVVRDEILEIFNEFTREENHTVLLSSHIISDLEKICDYIACLHQGQLLFCEEKDRLIEECGIIRMTKEDAKKIPKQVILGKRENKYGTELLVRRCNVSNSYEIEKTNMEEIMLFLLQNREV